ncbi:hypothetical protein OF83DRAFT_357032 [Amylostereum chailletii]|nr:hypothetical protein OF83DRAFT_357032 [Amylostereum chailletii]
MRRSPARVFTFFSIVVLFLALSANAFAFERRTFDSRAPAALHKRTLANRVFRLVHRQADGGGPGNGNGDGNTNDGNNGDTPGSISSVASSSTFLASSTRPTTVQPSVTSTEPPSSSSRPTSTSELPESSSAISSTSSAPPSTTSSSSSTRSSTTSSTTTSSAPLSTSSSSTKVSSSSVTRTSTSSSTHTSTSLALAPAVITVSSGPATDLFTVTSRVLASATAATDAGNSSSATGFFANTPAVAGTFTAVGLVGLAVVGYLVLFIARKRRPRERDEDFFEKYTRDAPASHPNEPTDIDVVSDPDAGHYAQPAPIGSYPDREIHYGQSVPQAGVDFGYPTQGYSHNAVYTVSAYGIEYPPGTEYQGSGQNPFSDEQQATQYAGVGAGGGAGGYGNQGAYATYDASRVSPTSSSNHPFADPSNVSRTYGTAPQVRHPQGGAAPRSNAEYAPSLDSFYGPSTPT